jgi:phage shock protein A
MVIGTQRFTKSPKKLLLLIEAKILLKIKDKEIREHKQAISNLRGYVGYLESQIDQLESQIDQLEKRLDEYEGNY